MRLHIVFVGNRLGEGLFCNDMSDGYDGTEILLPARLLRLEFSGGFWALGVWDLSEKTLALYQVPAGLAGRPSSLGLGTSPWANWHHDKEGEVLSRITPLAEALGRGRRPQGQGRQEPQEGDAT